MTLSSPAIEFERRSSAPLLAALGGEPGSDPLPGSHGVCRGLRAAGHGSSMHADRSVARECYLRRLQFVSPSAVAAKDRIVLLRGSIFRIDSVELPAHSLMSLIGGDS